MVSYDFQLKSYFLNDFYFVTEIHISCIICYTIIVMIEIKDSYYSYQYGLC